MLFRCNEGRLSDEECRTTRLKKRDRSHFGWQFEERKIDVLLFGHRVLSSRGPVSCMPPGSTRVCILCVASGVARVCAVLSQELPEANDNGAHVHRGGHA